MEGLPVAYAPFGIAQVERFARNWYGEYIPGPAEHRARISDLMDRLARNEGLGGLARVPVLLNMILFIHARRGRLPDGRAELYERIAETYLVALDRARQLRFQGRELTIDYQDMTRGLARIALAMQTRRTAEGAAVLLGEAEVKRHLREVPIESGFTEEVADTEVGFVLAYIAERSGLLLPRGFEAGEERYAYAHLSFQEFFAARALHAEIARPQPDPERWRDLESWSRSPQWHETLVLLFELFTDPGLSEYCADKLFGLAEGGVRVLEVLRKELTDRKGVVSSEPLALLAELAMDTAVRLRPEPRERLIRAAWESVFALSENLYSKEQLAVLRGAVSHLWAPRFASFDLLRQAGAGRRHLILPGRAVADLTSLAALTTLERLSLGGTAVQNLSPIAGLTKLNFLLLDDTAVQDLSPLTGLRKLEFLLLDNTAVQDLRPLAELTALERLWLNHTAVKELSPLAGLRKLESLSFDGTAVRDLSPLAGLTQLKELWCRGTDVKDLSPLRHIEGLQIHGGPE